MSKSDLLARLCEWFAEQCDGEWEHGAGIKINTLDNPGWIMRVTLRGTRSQDVVFEPVKIDKGENDWIECDVKEFLFTGAGDMSKIATILEVFLKFVGKL